MINVLKVVCDLEKMVACSLSFNFLKHEVILLSRIIIYNSCFTGEINSKEKTYDELNGKIYDLTVNFMSSIIKIQQFCTKISFRLGLTFL